MTVDDNMYPVCKKNNDIVCGGIPLRTLINVEIDFLNVESITTF